MGFDSFRRHVNQREQEKQNRKKKGGKPWGMEQFNLSIDEVSTVRFLGIPNDGSPYVRKFHWPANSAPKTCTAEIGEFGGKCCYCHYDQVHKAEEQKKADEARAKNQKYNKAQSRLSQKSQTVLEVIDFRYYHVVPEGENKIAQVCNVFGPEADKDRCEFCASEEPEVATRVFGSKRRWEMKDDHLAQIFAGHQKLQRICVHVDEAGQLCGQEAYVIDMLCPSCGNSVVDPEKVRRMATKDIEANSRKMHQCDNCGTKDLPDLVSACKSGKHDAIRGTIFDKNLVISCSGEKKQTWDGTEYEDKVFTVDTVSEPFESISDSLSNWGFSEEEIAKMCQPDNLAWKYRPEYLDPSKYDSTDEYVEAVLEAQANAINKPNPFAAVKATSGFRSASTRSFKRS